MNGQPEIPGLRTVADMLNEHERAQRTNWKNDGRGFQDELKLTAEGYRRAGIAKLEKVDPPTLYFIPKKNALYAIKQNLLCTY